MNNKIKVLIVDDSPLVRQVLKGIFEADKNFEVIGTAADPFIAVKEISKHTPDVITLDIEMPRMDGLTFLKKLMKQHPIPVVIISSLTQEGSVSAIRALEFGAVDIITKPKIVTHANFEEIKIQICDSVKAAAQAKVRKRMEVHVTPKHGADVLLSRRINKSMEETTDKIIALGASTGGTEALQFFLQSMPYDAPGIIIVQHMPELFTRAFANRLNGICKISVKEAEQGDAVIRGRALIAPGNYHMMLKRSGAKYFVEVTQGPLVNRHRPAVDVLFRSTATYAGKNAVGVIMTGMGDDGARGLLEMKEAGALTIAQNEETCVVYGMPREAVKMGAADKILGLPDIPGAVLKSLKYNVEQPAK